MYISVLCDDILCVGLRSQTLLELLAEPDVLYIQLNTSSTHLTTSPCPPSS